MGLLRIPFDWRPSLPPLRPLRFVRGLLRYYAVIRLPVSVYHWLLSLDFPMQLAIPSSRQANTGSPSSCARCFRTCQGLRPRRAQILLAITKNLILPSVSTDDVGALLLIIHFVPQSPGLFFPRSTLRLESYPSTRMTWGHPGWLDLECIGLAPTAPCQF